MCVSGPIHECHREGGDTERWAGFDFVMMEMDINEDTIARCLGGSQSIALLLLLSTEAMLAMLPPLWVMHGMTNDGRHPVSSHERLNYAQLDGPSGEYVFLSIHNGQ